MLDWPNEQYVRVYTRDTIEWLALSWLAQGLFALILRKCDRAGVIELGRLGRRGLAALLHAPWADIEGPLGELLADGCVEIREDDRPLLIVPNYIEAQEANSSDRQRKQVERARRRDKARAPSHALTPSHTPSHAVTPSVTDSHAPPLEPDNRSQNVTESHTESHAVTPSHTPSRSALCAEPNSADLSLLTNHHARATLPEPKSDDPVQRELIAELAKHEAFAGHDLADHAEAIAGYPQGNGKSWDRFSEWYLDAIRRVAAKVGGAKAAGEPWPAANVGSYLRQACRQPSEPNAAAQSRGGLAAPALRRGSPPPQGSAATADEVARITEQAQGVHALNRPRTP